MSIIMYNLFPRLIGYIENWHAHLERISYMKFNAIYLNPIQYSGLSGSLYAIKDYYRYNPLFFKENNVNKQELAIKKFINSAHKKKLKVIIDLVINHTSIDSPLIKEHPDWYRWNKDGTIYHPGAYENGKKIIEWGDLAEINNKKSPNKEELWAYWEKLVLKLIDLGFDGFRADAAYQVPSDLWKQLIKTAKSIKKDTIFIAETLGCTPEETEETAKAGFDYIFNSSKYWDFTEDWCIIQYNRFKKFTRTISFPESHDTTRLWTDMKGNEAEVKKRYLFSALFSSGVMIPIGFEYGFKHPLNVVNTSPYDWEEKNTELVEYIKSVNEIKLKYPVFQNDNDLTVLNNEDKRVLVLLKREKEQYGLIAINKDPQNYSRLYINNLFDVMKSKQIKDISPEFGNELTPPKYEYWLRPSQSKILVGL